MIGIGMHTDLVGANTVVPLSTFVFAFAGLAFAGGFHTFAVARAEVLHKELAHADALKKLQSEVDEAHKKAIAKIRNRMSRSHIISRASAQYRHEEKAHFVACTPNTRLVGNGKYSSEKTESEHPAPNKVWPVLKNRNS